MKTLQERIAETERDYAMIYRLIATSDVTVMRVAMLERLGKRLDILYAEHDAQEADSNANRDKH